MGKIDIVQSVIAVAIPTAILVLMLVIISAIGMGIVKELKADKELNHIFTVAGKVANKSFNNIERWAESP